MKSFHNDKSIKNHLGHMPHQLKGHDASELAHIIYQEKMVAVRGDVIQ